MMTRMQAIAAMRRSTMSCNADYLFRLRKAIMAPQSLMEKVMRSYNARHEWIACNIAGSWTTPFRLLWRREKVIRGCPTIEVYESPLE